MVVTNHGITPARLVAIDSSIPGSVDVASGLDASYLSIHTVLTRTMSSGQAGGGVVSVPVSVVVSCAVSVTASIVVSSTASVTVPVSVTSSLVSVGL